MITNINRRQFLQKTGGAIAATPFFLRCAKTVNKPNIVFFIADDMYPDMFNCLPEGKGKNLTPNIDRLAREGTILMNQYVVSPVCTPSRYNCLTGRYASRATNREFLDKTKEQENQTVIQWNSFITEKDKILPHYLGELGYKTAMVGKNHVVEAKGLYQFPDYQADPQQPDIKAKVVENYEKVRSAVLKCGFDYADGLYHNNPNFIGLGKLAVQNLDWITSAGVDFIDQNFATPFFLYFATTVPHQPSEPERSWNADPGVTAMGYINELPDVMPPRHTIPERTKAAGLEGKNKENLLWLDDSLGALLDRLEKYNLMDNTIIFFFNDHGQKAKGTLYQGGIFNPSIIWKKSGFKCGPVCEAPVSNVDFAPTILDFAGFTGETLFDGSSFRQLLNGNKIENRESFYFELGYARAVIKGKYKYYAVRYCGFAKNRTPQQRAEILKEFNYWREFRNMVVVNRDPLKPYSHLMIIPGGGHAENETYGKKPGYFDKDQLYDLETDPDEQNNLAQNLQFQQKLDEMKAELKNISMNYRESLIFKLMDDS